jgi:hypothetical protein
MPTGLLRLPNGALWNRGGLALDVPDCRRCDGACRHFSGLGNACFNRTYYLPLDGCSAPFDSCSWSLPGPCDPLGTQGPALEVRLTCDTMAYPKIGRYFTATDAARGTWAGPLDGYSLDLLCGNFDPRDLPENPLLPGVTATVAPAHGHQPTDLLEVYEEGLG